MALYNMLTTLCSWFFVQRGSLADPNAFLSKSVTRVNRAVTEQTRRAAAPEVKLACGGVRGAWEEGVAAFRGIPYGVAPIGTRRWKPAEPHACWGSDILHATADGNICYQGGKNQRESEDCLNLNVFVPAHLLAARAANLLVLVWIHGGSNFEGSVQFYGAIENIVRKADLVLVSMNYRLNIFGYLALPELSAADPRKVSGNYGITDQQLALKWVQQNVEGFRGDPNRVTLIGQSSGGSNILAHLASESSKGMFNRAIVLSGSTNITMTRMDKETQDQELILPRLTCLEHQKLLDCLYDMNTAELYSAMPSSYFNFYTFYDYPVDRRGLSAKVSTLLYVDSVTVNRPLPDALKSGLNDVPLLLSGMQAELDAFPDAALAEITRNEFRSFILSKFSSTYGPKASQQIFEFYKTFNQPQQAYALYALDADTAVSCGNRAVALSALQGFNSPIYWAVVDASPSHPFCAGDQSGLSCSRFSFHSWDFAAAAGIWNRINGMDANFQQWQEDVNFGARLLSTWFEFAVNGSLKQRGWRPVQEAKKGHTYTSVVKLNATLPTYDFKSDVCEFWESIGVSQQWYWVN